MTAEPAGVATPPAAAPSAPSVQASTGSSARTLRATDTPATGLRAAANVVSAYVGLTKPRIIELLLVTTVPVMFLAAGGVPPLGRVLATLVGGVLAAGSANTINCVLDRDIDEQMRRTRRRPLPRHAVGPGRAMTFGLVLGVAATLELGFAVNWLSALLALAANAFYVFGYTMLLKRRTVQNVVWGGIAGCFPTLIGWTAITDRLAWPPVVLFAVIFLWTPPHTWALALRYREDYASVDVPMLPVRASAIVTSRRILAYAAAMVVVSVLLWPIAHTTLLYPTIALVVGALFVAEAVGLLRRAYAGHTDAALRPMRLFHYSNVYVTLLFVAVAIDPLLH